ncbi:uncharacterized protein K452DRAFT_142049 [Aplosporella prunicola CBS 121167]|uniref:Uncharacterized protein n=1 Tax=Aplosporella prunicola CBS 121167 TaxID=1176127 RepID=A0A6A6BLB5_9PEZI|nr:uncharacterized protein K452DRAFT_142049 [Aplosporella prunicola CBS 121167]KAF2144458.1 hypothetical protein K452DRAFT_142049 [Aplosporella prunicola CBS 121167]
MELLPHACVLFLTINAFHPSPYSQPLTHSLSQPCPCVYPSICHRCACISSCVPMYANAQRARVPYQTKPNPKTAKKRI